MNKEREKELAALAQQETRRLLNPATDEQHTNGGKHCIFTDAFSKAITIGAYTTEFSAPLNRDEAEEDTSDTFPVIKQPENEEEQIFYQQCIIENLKKDARKSRMAIMDTIITLFEEEEKAFPQKFVEIQSGDGTFEDVSVLPKLAKKIRKILTPEQLQEIAVNVEELKKALTEAQKANNEKLETIQETIEDRNRHRGERPRITQKKAAEYILRAETQAHLTNRSSDPQSVLRRIKNWDAYIKSNGKKGTKPPEDYTRYMPSDNFAIWARDVYVRDERYNQISRPVFVPYNDLVRHKNGQNDE